jgi:succinyl-diaminopimelate desuccinylase
LELARTLIRCPSVTPEDGGALDALQGALTDLGFVCTRLPFSDQDTPDVDNLYARLGTEAPNFCFAGHTDVVPVGDRDGWTVDPFAAEVAGGALLGRGAADMKGAIAAFVAATARFLDRRKSAFAGSISLLITGDEEGPSINGTRKVLDWLDQQGESLSACLIGEPTNPETLGEMIKIGRRGSLSGTLRVTGIQGHAAYPDLADNPIPRLMRILTRLTDRRLDQGTQYFQPSNLEVTSVDVGNPAVNIIPGSASARFNIRFNDLHSDDDLRDWVREQCETEDGRYELSFQSTGEPFVTPPGPLSDTISAAITEVTGRVPELSTTGGTSDARFIKDRCPVAEFGLISQTMHKIDERTSVEDLEDLTRIYTEVLERYFPI